MLSIYGIDSYGTESDAFTPAFKILDPAILEQNQETPEHAFDMTYGNAISGVIIPHLEFFNDVSPAGNDVSIVLRYTTQFAAVAFDTVAPYHPYAVGIYSRIEHRPASEAETNLMPNTALMYAAYRYALAMDPERAGQWRSMMVLHGFDPNDDAGLDLDCNMIQNISEPSAIGNHAAKCVVEARRHDGFNQYGYQTPGMPMGDTTGYVPANTAYTLVDPTRWQPLFVTLGPGRYASQEFVTPQYANTATYSDIDPRNFRVPPPINSDHRNISGYKAQAAEILEASSSLTDMEKVTIEFYDNKRRPLPLAALSASVVESAQIMFMGEMARHDAGIVGWQEKTRYDTIRPVSAIRYLYHSETVTAPTAIKEGPTEIFGIEWNSYVSTGDHPEYPSVTTCLCSAYAQSYRMYTGGDTIPYYVLPDFTLVPGYSVHVEAGSSRWEPSVTPANDLIITFDTWTEFEQTCADSRVVAGLHFRAAVDASLDTCGQIGQETFEYWQTLIDGTAALRAPEKPLDRDPMLDEPFWTER